MADRKLKALVVDPDQEARLQLMAELQKHNDILLSDEDFADASAIQKIIKVKPDLVFMAVNLPMPDGLSAFGWLKKNVGNGFETVMLVENCEEAREALLCGAFDYLKKPLNADALEKTLLTFGVKKNLLNKAEESTRKVLYLPNCNKVCLPTPVGHIFIETDKIAYLKSKQKHCMLTDADNDSFEICLGLKTLALEIPDKEIKRIHKSFAISRRFLHSTQDKRNKCILKISGQLVEIPVSTRGGKILKEP